MGVQVTGWGMIVVGLGAVFVGTWAYSDGRRSNYGPAAMLAVAVVGFGLVLMGAGALAVGVWPSRILTWGGLAVAAVGAVVYMLNPRLFGRG